MTVDDTWLQRAEDYLENKPTYITETYAEMLVGEAIAEIERLHSMISQLREALVEERARHVFIRGTRPWPEYSGDEIERMRKMEARRELATEYPNLGPWGEEDDAK